MSELLTTPHTFSGGYLCDKCGHAIYHQIHTNRIPSEVARPTEQRLTDQHGNAIGDAVTRNAAPDNVALNEAAARPAELSAERYTAGQETNLLYYAQKDGCSKQPTSP